MATEQEFEVMREDYMWWVPTGRSCSCFCACKRVQAYVALAFRSAPACSVGSASCT